MTPMCRQTTSILSSKRGIALLVCLAIISVLSAAGLELGKRVRRSTDLAMALQENFKATEMAMAGIHLAMVILEADANANDVDSIQEIWADPEVINGAMASLGFPSGQMTLSIVDEMGKIQVNALLDQFPGSTFNNDQKELWERLLDLMISADKSQDDRDPSEIINSLKDWMDAEDDDLETGTSGAESAYYQGLVPPYTCANGPFDLLDELFLVKGLSQGLQATEALEGLEDPALEFQETFTVVGMDDKVTEKNRYRFPGTININTANALVIMALLPPGMEDQAQELVDFRVQKHEENGDYMNALDKGWYKEILGLSDKEEKRFDRLISYSSNFFRVTCSVTMEKKEHRMTAVIQRTKGKETNRWGCRIIRILRNQ